MNVSLNDQLADLTQTFSMTWDGRAPTGPAATQVTDDSRETASRSLFIARSAGANGGVNTNHIVAAAEAGAVAIIAPHGSAELIQAALNQDHGGSPAILLAENIDQSFAGQVAEHFYHYPARNLALLAVTGTNGKTTTAWLARHLLGQAGVKAGLIGTIETDTGSPDGPRPADLTTPGAVATTRLLAAMRDHGCSAAVMEASSHALHQGRLDALRFHAAAYTNLSGDHLDYHRTMDDYARAKSRLFTLLRDEPSAVSLLNADDAYHGTMRKANPPAARGVRLVARDAPNPDDTWAYVRVLELTTSGSRGRFVGPWGEVEARLPMIGSFNLMNALQAVGLAYAARPMSAQEVGKALESAPPVPGRVEPVGPNWPNPRREEDDATLPQVLVDYAHTDAALLNVASAVKPLVQGQLTVVFGCGGDRDRSKRPRMTQAACAFGDRVVLTSDNPRTEDPEQIIADAQAGAPKGFTGRFTTEPDRAAAIRLAIDQAEPGDTVLIAGKGHEDYQILGTTKHDFDDRKQAVDSLIRRG